MDRPKLRKVDRHEQPRGEETLVVVRDPLGIADPFAVDAEYSVVLDSLDGTHTLPQLRQSLLMRHGLDLRLADLRAFVADLREGGLLDDEAFRDRWAAVHTDFLRAPVRAPTLDGLVYPAHPGELAAALERAVPSTVLRTSPSSSVRGVMVPHDPPASAAQHRLIDLTLRNLPEPDRLHAVVVLGTDHGPGLVPYVATAKPYRTPLGVVPTASAFIDALERRIPWVLHEEIRQREALSIELAVLYLQHLYGERCPPIVPILCGQTALAPREGEAEHAERFVAAMEALCEDREILFWVSAELSHGGPAYGRPPLDHTGAARLAERDRAILDALRTPPAGALRTLCTAEHPQGRPSGGAALTAAAHLLPIGFRTEVVDYALVAAPVGNGGRIGHAGLRFHPPRGSQD